MWSKFKEKEAWSRKVNGRREYGEYEFVINSFGSYKMFRFTPFSVPSPSFFYFLLWEINYHNTFLAYSHESDKKINVINGLA